MLGQSIINFNPFWPKILDLIIHINVKSSGENKIDLRNEKPNITERDFTIIGFGALHGSSKTYEAELSLTKWLLEENMLDYYIIEANFSQAYYLEKYLETGNENLLKELVYAF